MRTLDTTLYDSLARLFEYPKEGYVLSADECLRRLSEAKSPGCEFVERFSEYAHKTELVELQELFTRTFEINPLCALEVGWQLFGERYERGTFIVKMRQTLRELELPESSELPDHLTHILQALGRLPAEEAAEFAGMFVVPAVEKMISGLKDMDNPYRGALRGIHDELKSIQSEQVQGASNG